MSTGPSQGQGRSGTRFLLATSGLARPFVFRTCSKGYSDLCMMPVSASLIQSVRAPNHGPVSDANSCSDGDPCARSSGTSLHGEETGRWLANRAAGHTDPGPKAAFRPNQTRRPQTLPRLRHQRYQPSRPPIYTTLTAGHLKPLGEGRATLVGINKRPVSTAIFYSFGVRFIRKSTCLKIWNDQKSDSCARKWCNKRQVSKGSTDFHFLR